MTTYNGLHETLEMHELLVFKNLCLTKSLLMGGLVQDEELKTILLNDAQASVKFVRALQDMVNKGGSKL
ncbi:hypothetical protein ACJ2A9_01300 [Anaerobacillus sp. MEB173]|uniref:hypothetical protein n=1 Tax=Anaerobacillus sp. MEB173 TaxID=3383345 RepID=UPI003F908859